MTTYARFPGGDVPIFPGQTPATAAHIYPAQASVAVRAPRTPGGMAGDGRTFPTPPDRHWALERLEDAFLLLLIVFAVPAIILLLALPFVVIGRVAAMIAAR